MAQFKFTITSPSGTNYSKEINSVNFLSSVGYLTILANHTNATGIIEKTKVKVNKDYIGYVANGVYRFYNNTLEFVVTNFAENENQLSSQFENKNAQLKLSNVKTDVASDMLLEIELTRNIKKSHQE